MIKHLANISAMLLLLVVTANAAEDTWHFDDLERQARFIDLTEELRCPKCQNQNLADSDAPIAADLRAQVYRLINEGMTDAEIRNWLVERYGDYVLYRPAWSGRTLLLWLTPAILLCVGLIVILLTVKRRKPIAGKADGQPLSTEERGRLNALLHEEQDD